MTVLERGVEWRRTCPVLLVVARESGRRVEGSAVNLAQIRAGVHGSPPAICKAEDAIEIGSGGTTWVNKEHKNMKS